MRETSLQVDLIEKGDMEVASRRPSSSLLLLMSSSPSRNGRYIADAS